MRLLLLYFAGLLWDFFFAKPLACFERAWERLQVRAATREQKRLFRLATERAVRKSRREHSYDHHEWTSTECEAARARAVVIGDSLVRAASRSGDPDAIELAQRDARAIVLLAKRRYRHALGLVATTKMHTDIAFGAAATAAVLDAPLGQLDNALADLESALGDYVITGGLPGTSANLGITQPATRAFVKNTWVSAAAAALVGITVNDNYIDLDNAGAYHVTSVANGAGAPAIFANSVRLYKAVASAGAITSIVDLRILASAVTKGGFNVLSFGAYPDNGTTNNQPLLAAAVAAAVAAGGGTVTIPFTATGVYGITLNWDVTTASNVAIIADPGVSIKWFGAINSVMLSSAPAGGSNLLRFRMSNLIFDGSNTAGITQLFLQSIQYARLEQITAIKGALTGGTTAAVRIEASAGGTSVNNSVFNVIDGMRISTCQVGFQLQGINGSGPTDNWFFGVQLDDVYQTGIREVQYCDSNNWYGVRIGATTVPNANWAGLILNDSATPTVDVGVYNEQFFGFFVDNNNGPASAAAIVLNWQKSLMVSGMWTSVGKGSPGTTVIDNNSQSHMIELLSDTGNLIRVITKGYKIGKLLVGADQANFWVLQGSGAGSGPIIVPAGQDANQNARLFGLGTGGVESASFFQADKDIRRSRQTPTEAVLVSGVDATAGEIVSVTLTAARLVGAPLNLAIGQYLTFELTEGGAGAFAVTWNAIFKKTWSDVGNATGKISSITYYYNGTNLVQTGAQAPYV